MSDRSLVAQVAKKLAPWIALVTGATTIGGYLLAAGKKTAELATKDDVRTVSAADMAVHKDVSDTLRTINEHLVAVDERQKAQKEVLDEIKAELKELRTRPGMRVTGGGR